tara:strand:+ start:1374 stop:1958 length:585 start_codon:yes stop_codon:yes gene_type:complete
MAIYGERDGRGRLSSIDKLPEDADADILWANDQLREMTVPANEILAEFNRRLAARGLGPISKSAFNRYSIRKARQFRKHDETRKMSAELVAQLGADGADEVTVMIAELLKVAMFDLLDGGTADSKAIMELSRALQATVNAQRGSEEYRRKLEQRVSAEMERAADNLESVARENGLSADRVAQLRRDFLGVKDGK